jgi:phospholipase/lecithinase/hemolysin
MKNLKARGLALAAAALLTACGGGGSDTTPRGTISAVHVFGDSLADVGTFSNIKATVQGADSLIYPERVARLYGQTLCRYFVATGATAFVNNPEPGCTGYAVGGGRINPTTAPSTPLSIRAQLQTIGTTTTYTDKDLLVIDGGGNDAADLVGAYLQAGTNATPYITLLGTLISSGELSAYLSPAGFRTAGGVYMTRLADAFADSITAHALDKGATRVLILNMPSITKTPRFQLVLNSVAAATAGAGGNGPQARVDAENLFMGWLQAFNTRLAARFAGNSKVVVVDFYTAFNDQVADPAQYGLTNAITPACPIKGVGSDGLPTYSFATCTDTALSAAPPAGVTDPNWWRTYAFADGFHPTPAAHQLVSQLISRALSRAGWL